MLARQLNLQQKRIILSRMTEIPLFKIEESKLNFKERTQLLTAISFLCKKNLTIPKKDFIPLEYYIDSFIKHFKPHFYK